MTANGVGTCGADDNQAQAGHLITQEFNWQSGGDARGLDPDEVTSALTSQQTPAVFRKSQRAHSAEDGETWVDAETSNTLNAHDDHDDARATVAVAHALTAEGFDASANALRQPNGGRDGLGVGAVCMASAQANAEIVSEGSPNLTCTHDGPPIVMRESGQGFWTQDDIAGTLDANMGQSCHGNRAATIESRMAVRRLTPRECERLQGMPDDWTLVEWNGKPAPDGKRYAAVGNSMAVNVMRFIGERIAAVEEVTPMNGGSEKAVQ